VDDLGEVLLVEQRHLQRPAVGGQGGDGRGTQAGQPAHAILVGQLTQRVDSR
jgi:hypothetical protein